ncbi:O-antigen ligase family protein [Clostridium swellfunianum]|uniref:O-antigen ligase family protein n=1 Tax=Clostridium swellfunianum TaxID=1367462 RepID=UPI00202FB1E1|nr:O-antigen ligase family protein [Clostridium swellfunianum]MCM0647411.1 O-antigen ligase family protein [Clostridium swellfunianum]
MKLSLSRYLVVFGALLAFAFSALGAFNIKFSAGILLLLISIIFISKPILWIYFLCIYIPLETVILNFTPNNIVSLVRYGTEAFTYVILFFCLIRFLRNRRNIKLYSYDFYIFIFIIVCILSIAINRVNITIAILGLRWLIRYVAVYFILKLEDWHLSTHKKIFNVIYVTIVFELIVALFQFFFRERLDIILQPKVLDLGFVTVSINQLESRYAIFATFGRYGIFGYFMTIATIVAAVDYFYKNRNKKSFILLLISIIVLILTYARQAVIAVIISSIYMFYFTTKSKKTKFKVTVILSVIAIISIMGIGAANFEAGKGILNESISKRYLSIFTKEYIQADYSGRGRTYFITKVNKMFLTTKPFIGYGVGMYGTRTAIDYDRKVYAQLGIPIEFSMDVYWTSILGQIGVFGLISLILIFYKFFKASKKIYTVSGGFQKRFSLIVVLLIIAVIFESFFGSNLSDRYQAFYIWLFFGMLTSLENKLEVN